MNTKFKIGLIVGLILIVTAVVFAQAAPFFRLYKSANVASAATISLRGINYAHITGTAQIDSISGGIEGQVVVLTHNAADTLLDGKNLKLAGNFPGTADDSIVLIYNGTHWIELDRSAN